MRNDGVGVNPTMPWTFERASAGEQSLDEETGHFNEFLSLLLSVPPAGGAKSAEEPDIESPGELD